MDDAQWRGRVDGHCFYLWHSSLCLLHADYISLGVNDQPWRKAQHLCFHPADALAPLHVYHLHSPSPGKKNPKQDRRLSKKAREIILSTICHHALQQHRSGAAQPAVEDLQYTEESTWPSLLLTGDFNNTASQWRHFLSNLVPEGILNHAQLVWSTMLRKRKHGDHIIAINCEAYQEEGPDWTTFSDSHDVVLAPVRLRAMTTISSGTDDDLGPTEDRSAAQPALESMGHNPTKAVSSAELTQVMVERAPTEDPDVAQHVPEIAECIPAETLNAPRQNTPMYTQFVKNLADLEPTNAEDDGRRKTFNVITSLEQMLQMYMFRDVVNKSVPGHWAEEASDLVQRLEWVLALLSDRRRAWCSQPDAIFSDDDIKGIMNSWRNFPRLWMDPNKFASYQALVGTKKHNVLKSRFSSMKFQLLGNAALVDYIIRFNLCGAVQPEALCAFCKKWANYTNSDEHKKAKQMSEEREPGHMRRAKQIWILQQRIGRGQWIAQWVDERWSNRLSLSTSDQEIYDDYVSGRIHKSLREVLATPAKPRYAGAGCLIANSCSR